jgi:hypothetical protein
MYEVGGTKECRTGDPFGVWKSCSRGASELMCKEEQHSILMEEVGVI